MLILSGGAQRLKQEVTEIAHDQDGDGEETDKELDGIDAAKQHRGPEREGQHDWPIEDREDGRCDQRFLAEGE